MVDPDIKCGFGGDDGIEGFKRMWWLDEPSTTELWAELGAVLALGGTLDGDYFIAPYTFSRWPDDVDAFEHVVAVSNAVPAHAAPREDAPVVDTLEFSIVRIGPRGYEGGPDGWQQILLRDGREAYVRPGSVRSPPSTTAPPSPASRASGV